jgi:acyl carrier protein
MDREEAFATFQECVAEVLDIDPEEVQPTAKWREDLDADSLAVVEITLALNDAFSIKIPDVDPEQLETVGQAFDLVADLVGVDPAPHATARPGGARDSGP